MLKITESRARVYGSSLIENRVMLGESQDVTGFETMPKLQVAGAALVTLRWQQGSASWHNVIGVSIPPGTLVTQTLANELATDTAALFTGSTFQSDLATSTIFQTVAIRDIRNVDLPEFVGTPFNLPGTGTGDPLPLKDALCITLRTAGAGQSNRGRVYLSGFTEASNDTTGTVLTQTVTNAVNFITAMGTVLIGNTLTLAVVSRPAERVQIVTTTFHADGTTDVDTVTRNARTGKVTNVTLIEARNDVWDSQRRRTSGGSAGTLLNFSAWRKDAPMSV